MSNETMWIIGNNIWLGDSFPWVPYVKIHILSAELLIAFVPDLFSKMSFKTFYSRVASNLGIYISCHPPEQSADLFAAQYNNVNKTQ